MFHPIPNQEMENRNEEMGIFSHHKTHHKGNVLRRAFGGVKNLIFPNKNKSDTGREGGKEEERQTVRGDIKHKHINYEQTENVKDKKILGYRMFKGIDCLDIEGSEAEFRQDNLTYMLNYQMPSSDVCTSHILPTRRRIAVMEFVWNVFNHRQRTLEVYFHAVHLCEATLRNFFDTASHNYDEQASQPENYEEELAAMVVAAVEVASKVDCQRGIARHFTDRYPVELVRKWESRHLVSCNFALSRHHVLHFLRLIHPISFQVVPVERNRYFWHICKAIAVISTFSAEATNCLPSRVAAAVFRIALAVEDVELACEDLVYLQHPEGEYADICVKIIETVQQLQEKRKVEVFTFYSLHEVAAFDFSPILDYFEDVATETEPMDIS